MMHNVRIIQIFAILFSFMSWALVIFVHVIMGENPISKFESFMI
jgi:hypothetical protein